MARGDRLPGLSAQLRRHGWGRDRRPAGDHRAPRSPGTRWAGRRRRLAVADLPEPGLRCRLRRQRPFRGRSAAGDGGRLRPAGPGGARTRPPRDPRPRDEPHERPARLVPGEPTVARGAVRRLLPVARSGRSGRRRQPAAAEQLAVVLRRFRVAVRAGPGPVLHAHLPRRATRGELAQPGGRGGAAEDGPRLAGPRRRRLSARRVQHLPQGPGDALEPGARGGRGRARAPGTARSTSTTATSPTSRS